MILMRIRQIVLAWIGPNLRAFLATRQPMIWMLALMVGVAVAAAAILFREAIGLVQLVWLGDRSEFVASAAAQTHWLFVLLAPAAGGLLVGLALQYWLRARRTGGVPDVIEARASSGTRLGFREGVKSALVTALSLGSGASAGREGPVVHLGATIAASIGRFFRLPPWAARTLLGCGVAAAVSASFNAPIAGVLFAHEVILGHYAMRAFTPIVISSTVATLLSRLWFGDNAAFSIPPYSIASFWEFPAFALLGLTCGLVAVIFQLVLAATDYLARSVTMPLVLRPVVGGFMVGAIGVFLPEVLGVGYEATDAALQNQLPLTLMLTLLVAKTAATAITLASRFGGGVFSPSLYLGAMTGGSFGVIAAGMFPTMASSEGLYAILGMGAVAAAVLGAPISTTVMVFELTGGFALSIALLLAVSIANGVNNAIHGRSYFHWQLEMRGLFVADGPSRQVTLTRKVSDFMTPFAPDAEPLMVEDPSRPVLRESDTLEHALRVFDSTGLESLPVISAAEPGRIIGSATLLKALRYFNSALVEASDEQHQH